MRGLIVVTALILGVSASPAAADTAPSLPDPTGRQPVGSTSLYLKDTSRPDTWVPSVPYRELMVSVFYPTAAKHGPRTQYMTPAESAGLVVEDAGITDVPSDLLSRTRTNSVSDARPVGRWHGLPLVVMSPGANKPRNVLTALAEDLASHGYVVALVGHTYENYAQSFPDGRVTGCVACEVDHLPGFWEKLATSRAADVSFVLGELPSKWYGGRLIDPRRVAMGGHSAGGGSTTTAMLADSRIKAGFDLDGRNYIPIPASGLSRPFMFLGRQFPGGPEWERDWPQVTGWKRWLSLTGAAHTSFTDVGLFADYLGIDYGADIGADRVHAITRAYVNAFFDQHLRGKPRPLLDGPSTQNPEVVFCH